MLDEIGEEKGASDIVKAIEEVIKEAKVRTKDMGGTATTSQMGDAIVKKLTK